MQEKVRLVVWDLDETFWSGTLTEGGMKIRPEHCEIVRTLAKRGIMSSICSKNDFNTIKEILEKEGIWEYFIFPSIDWSPKGPRVAALVEAVQLRAPTILFIDDNPMNLAEVEATVPGIQVRRETFIPEMLSHPLFAGKDDSGLTRLAQYKLLETRKRDEQAAGGDNTDFLRESNIQVDFERDLEKHIDRVVELINRTNQLNFTKVRLSDEPAEARKQALELLSQYNIQAALIRVRDRYGDHGFAGLYVMNGVSKMLLHFAFSCRILGMGVEQWLYNRIGRPSLKINGEVLSDPKDTSRTVDWINRENNAVLRHEIKKLNVDCILAHGGCDLSAVTHYFSLHGVDLAPKFNLMRDGFNFRIDHSIFLKYSSSGGLKRPQLDVARRMGYVKEDFESEIFVPSDKRRYLFVSFATDAHYGLYRHRDTGLVIPSPLHLGSVEQDQRKFELKPEQQKGRNIEVHEILKSEFDFIGLINESEFKNNLKSVFSYTWANNKILVIRPNDYHLNKITKEKYFSKSFTDINRWTIEVASGWPNARLIDIINYVENEEEIHSILHYDRKVYFRIYKDIIDNI